MRLKATIITGISTLAFLTLAAGSLQAQVPCLITITATALVQNNNFAYNGSTITVPVPAKVAIDTKQILGELAIAENAEGNYLPGPSFPAGAKLVVVISNGTGNSPDFQVLDKKNNLLVDVSDILSGNYTGNNASDIFSGKQSDVGGLSNPTATDLQIFTITYDDTAIAGSDNLTLYLTGLSTNTVTDTVPNHLTGAYTETQSHNMTGAAGDGADNLNTFIFVITGNFTATGKAKLVLP